MLKFQNSYPRRYCIALTTSTNIIDSYASLTFSNKEDAIDYKEQLNGSLEHMGDERKAIVLEYEKPSLLNAQADKAINKLKNKTV